MKKNIASLMVLFVVLLSSVYYCKKKASVNYIDINAFNADLEGESRTYMPVSNENLGDKVLVFYKKDGDEQVLSTGASLKNQVLRSADLLENATIVRLETYTGTSFYPKNFTQTKDIPKITLNTLSLATEIKDGNTMMHIPDDVILGEDGALILVKVKDDNGNEIYTCGQIRGKTLLIKGVYEVTQIINGEGIAKNEYEFGLSTLLDGTTLALNAEVHASGLAKLSFVFEDKKGVLDITALGGVQLKQNRNTFPLQFQKKDGNNYHYTLPLSDWAKIKDGEVSLYAMKKEDKQFIKKQYEIKDIEDFYAMDMDMAGIYTLLNDLDFTTGYKGFAMDENKPFKGSFNGKDKRTLKFSKDTWEVYKGKSTSFGIFANAAGANFRHLKLVVDNNLMLEDNGGMQVGLLTGVCAGCNFEGIDIETKDIEVTSRNGHIYFGTLVGQATGAFIKMGANENRGIRLIGGNYEIKGKSGSVLGGLLGYATNENNMNLELSGNISIKLKKLSSITESKSPATSGYAGASYAGGMIGGFRGKNMLIPKDKVNDNMEVTTEEIISSGFDASATGGLIGFITVNGNVIVDASKIKVSTGILNSESKEKRPNDPSGTPYLAGASGLIGRLRGDPKLDCQNCDEINANVTVGGETADNIRDKNKLTVSVNLDSGKQDMSKFMGYLIGYPATPKLPATTPRMLPEMQENNNTTGSGVRN